MATRPVLQFKITLQDINPPIWRRIQISDLCRFWDLHVAIQDAMGWHDCHLHLFTMNHSIVEGKHFFGFPEDIDYEDFQTLPSWEYKVRDYLVINECFKYEYDFGDGWVHLIEFEGVFPKQSDTKYPICLDGERACPPEDIGGPPGYEQFVELLQTISPADRDLLLHEDIRAYEPEFFEPTLVKFDNSNRRLNRIFKHSY
jgi:hypothetical protein